MKLPVAVICPRCGRRIQQIRWIHGNDQYFVFLAPHNYDALGVGACPGSTIPVPVDMELEQERII